MPPMHLRIGDGRVRVLIDVNSYKKFKIYIQKYQYLIMWTIKFTYLRIVIQLVTFLWHNEALSLALRAECRIDFAIKNSFLLHSIENLLWQQLKL